MTYAIAPDIKGNLDAFLCRRSPATRYASFDYCFNYFQDARDAQETVGLASGDRLECPVLLSGQLGHDARVGRSARSHHRKNNAIPPAYAFVVSSEPSRPNRT